MTGFQTRACQVSLFTSSIFELKSSFSPRSCVNPINEAGTVNLLSPQQVTVVTLCSSARFFASQTSLLARRFTNINNTSTMSKCFHLYSYISIDSTIQSNVFGAPKSCQTFCCLREEDVLFRFFRVLCLVGNMCSLLIIIMFFVLCKYHLQLLESYF